MRLKDTHCFLYSFLSMTATLDLPLPIAIAALRAAGTGDNLLTALDALITYTDETPVVTDTQEPAEWVNAVNLEDETVADETVSV